MTDFNTKKHSFAHLMAAAVGQMFPEAQYGVGPVIENGCYYDFILPRTLVPEDLPILEAKIQTMLKSHLSFKYQEYSIEDAIIHFEKANQPLKVELLENLRDKGTTSMSEEEKLDFKVSPPLGGDQRSEGVLKNSGGVLKNTSRKIEKLGILPYNQSLLEKACELRKNSSPMEVRFWCESKNYVGFDKITINRQKPVLEYILDFYLPEFGIAIEIDGESHNNQVEYDAQRTLELENLGITVLRFTNQEIKENLQEVFDKIASFFNTHRPSDTSQGRISSEFLENFQVGTRPTITLYRITDEKTGEIIFEDLCRGPHIEHVKEIKNIGFKLDKFSAAYWRGDQARGVNMQRLYALVFETKDELKTFVEQRDEAKKRDHRILGQSLKLFTISELVGSGLPLLQPKGAIIRKILEDYLWQLQKHSHQRVYTPHITKEALYEKSGHAGKYLEDMFSVYGGTSKETFFLKPMNCPMHMQIFADNQFSYRDMPVRYFDPTTVYRDEKTGAIGGLTRVRSITQDDGHIFCRTSQIEAEFTAIVATIREFYAAVGMTPDWVSWSVRDSQDLGKYLGSTENWDIAEEAIRKAAESNGLTYKRCEGEAAFYGPKLDFMFKDCIGREWQLSTIQCDFVQPERFELGFVNENGEKEQPVVIHRAISGSLERFMGIIIEHFAGWFPFWLSPVQVKILTINDTVLPFVEQIKAVLDETVLMKPLKYNEIRYEVDSRSESLNKKIRDARLEKIPMLMVIGQKDVDANQVSIEYNGQSTKVNLSELKSWIENIK